jgi:hypothetical protein
MNPDGEGTWYRKEDLLTMENIDTPYIEEELLDPLETLQRKLEKFRRRKENKIVR